MLMMQQLLQSGGAASGATSNNPMLLAAQMSMLGGQSGSGSMDMLFMSQLMQQQQQQTLPQPMQTDISMQQVATAAANAAVQQFTPQLQAMQQQLHSLQQQQSTPNQTPTPVLALPAPPTPPAAAGPMAPALSHGASLPATPELRQHLKDLLIHNTTSPAVFQALSDAPVTLVRDLMNAIVGEGQYTTKPQAAYLLAHVCYENRQTFLQLLG
jgi:hypothetical protein